MGRDCNKQRMSLLRYNLQQELMSDNPGMLYIEDLQLSIERLEREMQYDYIMVNGDAPSLS